MAAHNNSLVKRDAKTRAKVEKLARILNGKSNLLIVMQDNPDPDSIAAAVALRKLANTLAQVQCSIAHGGTVGRGENRALVRYLNLNLRPFDQIVLERFDLTAMVDTQPGAGNNSFPPAQVPDIVIDHHSIRRITRSAQLADVQRGYGATATILFEYLCHAAITPDVPLATALLYAIRSDTQDLGTEAAHADIEAIGALYPIANKRILSHIQRGKVQREYFHLLARAIETARIYDNCIITYLGEITIPDIVGEVADLLLRDDHATWALCYGRFREKLLLSIRTSDTTKRADIVMRQVVARRGTAGGHDTIAGGQIPLTKGTKTELAKIERAIRRKLLKSLGIEEHHAQSLTKSRKT